jgi:uncharacterized membrane protein YozB (DUF420 family)
VNIHSLPLLNAILNGTAAILLLTGYSLIRSGNREAHRKAMLSAFGVSVLFLISYLVYHWHVGSVHYPHEGILRYIYLTILLTHTLLAATVPVLAIITLRRALKGQIARHKKLAKWTFPIWLYVSVTGVVVYLMLYQF